MPDASRGLLRLHCLQLPARDLLCQVFYLSQDRVRHRWLLPLSGLLASLVHANAARVRASRQLDGRPVPVLVLRGDALDDGHRLFLPRAVLVGA